MKSTMKLVLILIFAVGAIGVSAHKVVPGSHHKEILFAMPATAKYFTFGYNDVIADAAWIRALQSIGACGEHRRDVTKGVHIGPNRVARCHDGWSYRMLDLVMTLAPRWRLPQRVGPMLLSIFVDDRDGATKLFNKAVNNFPNDWRILTRAGYHYLYEDHDYMKAAMVYNRAAKQPGAPQWCRYLAAKLYQENGRLHVAKLVLENFLKSPGISKFGLEMAKKRLEDINKQLAALQLKHEFEEPAPKHPVFPTHDRILK